MAQCAVSRWRAHTATINIACLAYRRSIAPHVGLTLSASVCACVEAKSGDALGTYSVDIAGKAPGGLSNAKDEECLVGVLGADNEIRNAVAISIADTAE